MSPTLFQSITFKVLGIGFLALLMLIPLAQVQSLIGELQQLHDFLASEGERLEREISEYAQLTKSTKSSTQLVADNMLHWKRAHGD